MYYLTLFVICICGLFCRSAQVHVQDQRNIQDHQKSKSYKGLDSILCGAENLESYISALKGKRVAVFCNQTSLCYGKHLVDTLLNSGVYIVKLFAPEHGIRGVQSAGEHIDDQKDSRTGLPIISLYGSKKKKPNVQDLSNVDIFLFDIQDVGVRFYTYISSLHYIMEACAEFSIPLYVLDRPNPNIHYVDGPVLDTNLRSFVGVDPIPIVYGLSIGELARMIKGEKWIANSSKLDLSVVPCLQYTRQDRYKLNTKPSPNLKNMDAILLYPSLCLFEGTDISLGRGTDHPFEIYGHPSFKSSGEVEFVPYDMEGAIDPPHEGMKCYGFQVKKASLNQYYNKSKLDLSYLMHAFELYPDKDHFFKEDFFNKLAGNTTLIQQIRSEITENEIRRSWEPALKNFIIKRKNYLIYPQ